MYARRPFMCVPLNGRHRRARLCWARHHDFRTRQLWVSLLFTDESRFRLHSDSGSVLVWKKQGTRYNQSNIVERHSFGSGVIIVYAGISLSLHTDLHVFYGGNLTGMRFCDEILDAYVLPYAAAIGNDFILMNDNARTPRAVFVEDYFKSQC